MTLLSVATAAASSAEAGITHADIVVASMAIVSIDAKIFFTILPPLIVNFFDEVPL